MTHLSPREEYIEADILEYLTLQWVSCEKIVQEGFYDLNKGIYRRRKSNYVRKGSADIHWTIPPHGRSLYIEVKKPSEMAFFDRSIDDLTERMVQSTAKKKDRHQHAIDQRAYLNEKIHTGAVAFFASSIPEVIQRLRENGVEVT